MALITSGCGKIKQRNALQATEQKKTMAAAVEAQTAAAQVGVRPGKELQLRICEGCEEFPRVIDLRSVPSRHCERFTRQFVIVTQKSCSCRHATPRTQVESKERRGERTQGVVRLPFCHILTPLPCGAAAGGRQHRGADGRVREQAARGRAPRRHRRGAARPSEGCPIHALQVAYLLACQWWCGEADRPCPVYTF